MKHAEIYAAMSPNIIHTQTQLGRLYIKAGEIEKATAFRAGLPDHMAKKIELPAEQG